jgi:hypothetical protein
MLADILVSDNRQYALLEFPSRSDKDHRDFRFRFGLAADPELVEHAINHRRAEDIDFFLLMNRFALVACVEQLRGNSAV